MMRAIQAVQLRPRGTREHVRTLEATLAEYLGISQVVAVSSGTAALHLAQLAVGIGPGDQVITSALAPVSTASAILMAGATPVFVDVEPATGNLDVAKVEAAVTPYTRAIIPSHVDGTMCDMKRLRELVDCRSLALLEDATRCASGDRDAVYPGQLADAACFSFEACGSNGSLIEGGAVVGEAASLRECVERLSHQGRTGATGDMIVLGWKCDLDDLRAELLLPGIERLERALLRRLAIAASYRDQLQNLDGLDLAAIPTGARSAHTGFTIRAPRGLRDAMVAELREKGVAAEASPRAIHLASYFRLRFGHRHDTFPIAEEIGERAISLPMNDRLTDADVEGVIDAVRDVWYGHLEPRGTWKLSPPPLPRLRPAA